MSDVYIDSVKPMDLGSIPYNDGNYWQLENPESVKQHKEFIAGKLATGRIADLSLFEYQKFTELDWMRPHGEFRTVLKMEEHLLSEHREFVDANDPFNRKKNSGRVEKLLDSDTHETVSELGDILWFINAFGVNGGVDVERSFRYYLDSNFRIKVPAELKADTIDELVAEGLTARIGNFELDEDVAVDLFFAAAFTSVGTKIILKEHSERSLAVHLKQQEVGYWISVGMGLVALHAQNIGSSFSKVVETNIQKVSLRAELGNLATKDNRSNDEL
jgi:hypothetical protein